MEDPQSPEELARIHEQLWQTVLQFGNFSASQERNRIARDLHDSLGQALTALNIQLQTAVKLWQLDPERAEQFLEEAQRLGSTAVQEVRQTVRTLRTDCPDEQSLETLITSLMESFHRSTGVLPTVKLNLVAPVPPEVVTPVYRIIQEGLNNICKYAQATEVNLQLSTTPTSLGLIIEDNGRGFNLDQTVTGFGLRGMQERVSLLRGRFQVETQPGSGCRIRIVMPLRVLSLQDGPDLIPPPPTPDEGSPPAPLPSHSAQPAPTVERAVPPLPETALNPISDGQPQGSPALPKVELSSAQIEHLTRLLLQWVGPIAPILLQRAISQAHHPSDLIHALALHLPPLQRGSLEQYFQELFDPAPAPSSNPEPLPIPPPEALPLMPQSTPSQSGLDAELTRYCEHELTALIGPVAHFLIQQALATSPNLSLDQLLDGLSTHIPNPQTATQFKQRIRSFVSS